MVVIFTGCVKDAKESVQNGNFVVEFLFEENGCKMYRFKDGMRYVYWSDCRGNTQYEYKSKNGNHPIDAITTK